MGGDGLGGHGVPRPGDPRHDGPRPEATWRDLFWASLAFGLGAGTLVQFVVLGARLLQLQVRPSVGGVLLGFLITVAWLLTIYWLALGAWRRSIWGCPFRHTEDGYVGARCPRHRRLANGP